MQPELFSGRLRLRAFKLSDGERVALLAGDKRISDMTANIPHPYHPEMAVSWIKDHADNFSNKHGMTFAITQKENDDIIGAVSLMHNKEGASVLGYWLGTEHWGKGITYEAANTLIEFGKQEFELKLVKVMHLVENHQSQRVIEKLGFKYKKNIVLKMQGAERELKTYELKL